MDDEDARWMGEALAEAAKGLGLTAPNPPVGAVLTRGGVELGRGWHRRAGEPHAERMALADALARHGADAARGATAYVTLEPCSTTGRTPACTAGLVEHGVARVVYGCEDPNPVHAGRARAMFEAAGIEVVAGVRAAECARLLRGFTSAMRRGRPWLIAKSAQSLDAAITRPPGEGQWLTCQDSRAEVQRLRATVDAILTSGETLRNDNPALNLRVPHPHGDKPPLRRIIVTRSGRLPADATVFTDAFAGDTLVATLGHDRRPPGLPERVAHAGFAHWLDLLAHLTGKLEIHRLLAEAGGRLLGALFDARLIDEWDGWFAPLVTGGGPPGLGGLGYGNARESATLGEAEYSRIGDDVRIRGVVRYPDPAPRVLRPAAFFDRDGVVNDTGPHYYITRREDFVFQPGIIRLLKGLKDAGYALVLVTSQRGVGKGLMTDSDLAGIHAMMQETLAANGCAFDAIHAYTGLAEDGRGAKPDPYFIHLAAEQLGLDLGASWMVGDADRDIEMGRRAGLKTIRVGARGPATVGADYAFGSVRELAEHFPWSPAQ